MKNILSKLADIIDKSNLEQIAEEIDRYYRENGRHSYSEVSTFVYSIEDDEIDYLLKNLTDIRTILTGKEDEDSKQAANKIFKLIDHIQLESARENHIKNAYIEELKEVISINAQRDFAKIRNIQITMENKQNENNKDIEEQRKKITDEFNKQTTEIDKINSNLISVLGIFGAIIVAFFGGLNLLGSILDNIGSISAYRLAFMAIVCLQGLFNVIFMLLHCISKMINKPLWSNCKDCTSCNGRGNKITCLYTKYPLVIVYNLISIWGMITLFVMYVVDKYDVIKSILKMFNGTDNGIIMFIASILLMITFECILILVAKWLYEKYKEKCNCSNNLISNNSEENINPHEIEQRQEEEV